MICPICNYKGAFESFGLKLRKNARCPKCKSLERHRLYYVVIKNFGALGRSLHIAPERSLVELIKKQSLTYTPADLSTGEDIQDLPFKDESFDFIMCSHVLEHVEDDIKAMKELHRVLSKTGIAIIQVPISDRRNTYEDSSIKDPKEREKHFGQWDHVREYGKDFFLRMMQSGFVMERVARRPNMTDSNLSKEFIVIWEK